MQDSLWGLPFKDGKELFSGGGYAIFYITISEESLLVLHLILGSDSAQ